ncbi:hypothetical protein HOF92_15730 [bacterium]|jgi:flagellin|nr:hypothetical protein [bacterium]
MGFRINSNVSALSTQNYLRQSQGGLSTSIERLSSGLKVNRGADDAAGLTVSQKFRAQIRGLHQSIGNAQDGISLVQTAEGALNEDHSILNRMRELTIQSQSDALTSNDRIEIQKEVDQLLSEIDRISQTTEFNTKKLIDGSAAGLASTDRKELNAFQTGDGIAPGDYQVTLSLRSTGRKQQQMSAILSDSETGRTATRGTRLGDLTSMTDAQGNNFLETPETLTLYGGGTSAEIQLTKSMTVDQLARRVENAVLTSEAEGGLGVDGSTFRFDSRTSQLIFNSGRDGLPGEVSFSAGEDILNALALSISVESEHAGYDVNAIETGVADPKTFTSSTTTNRAFDALEGLDVTFDLATEARIDGELAGEQSIQIGINDVVFTFHDTNGTNTGQGAANISAGVTITLTNGRTFTTTSITQLISNAVVASNDPSNPLTGATSSQFQQPGISANFDALGNLTLTSSTSGTSGSISIAANSAAGTVLGVTSGLTSGGGGNAALLSGANIAGGVVFAGTGVLRTQVADGDYNTAPTSTSNDVTFNRGVVISAASVISEYNSYFTANNIGAVAVNNAGTLELQTTQTGDDARISITSTGGASLAAIGLFSGANAVGSGGTAAIYTGATGAPNLTTGYVLDGHMSFTVTDQSGAETNTITFGTANTIASESFAISREQITSIFTTSNLSSTAVGFSFDDAGNLDFVSSSPGRNSRIVLKSDSSAQGIGQDAFGIDFNKESQGTGEITFDIHVTDRTLQFELGANKGQFLGFQIANASSESLGLKGLDITTMHSSTRALGKIDAAINQVSSERSKLGSIQNRFSSAVNSLTVAHSNQTNFESQIRDVDLAEETVKFTRDQLLTQVGTAQLSQSKNLSQGGMSLLGL